MIDMHNAEQMIFNLKKLSSYDCFQKYKLLYLIQQETNDSEIIEEAQNTVNNLTGKLLNSTLVQYQTPIDCLSAGLADIYFDIDDCIPKEPDDESDYYALKCSYEEIYNYYMNIVKHVHTLVGDLKDFISKMILDGVDNHPVMSISHDVFSIPQSLDKQLNLNRHLKYQYIEDKTLPLNDRYKKLYSLYKNLEDDVSEYGKYYENCSGDMYINKMVVCFTGFRENNWAENLKVYGGKYVSAVTSNCNILVCKSTNATSSKIKEARNNGISVISKDDFEIVLSFLGISCY